MEKLRSLISVMIVVMVCFLYACGGGGGGSAAGGGGSATGVTITGSLGGSSHASVIDRMMDKIITKAYALDPSQVYKVIAFQAEESLISERGWGLRVKYTSALVDDDRNFTISVDRTSPVGLIFVNATNGYLGYLSLRNGVSAIPVDQVSAGSTINLGDLSSLGDIVSAENDPLASMSDTEIESLESISSTYYTVAHNPDVDGNSVIDFLEGKNYFIQFVYTFDSGKFEAGSHEAAINNFRVNSGSLSLGPPSSFQPESLTFQGPEGSGYEIPIAMTKSLADAETGRYGYSLTLGRNLLPGGTYTMASGSESGDLIFHLADQSSLMSKVAVPVPTVSTNADGTIDKISWTYKNPDGSNSTVDPSSFISVIHINMSSSVPIKDCGGNPWCDPYGYSTIFANSTDYEVDVSAKGIPWENISLMNVGYTEKNTNAKAFYFRK